MSQLQRLENEDAYLPKQTYVLTATFGQPSTMFVPFCASLQHLRMVLQRQLLRGGALYRGCGWSCSNTKCALHKPPACPPQHSLSFLFYHGGGHLRKFSDSNNLLIAQEPPPKINIFFPIKGNTGIIVIYSFGALKQIVAVGIPELWGDAGAHQRVHDRA